MSVEEKENLEVLFNYLFFDNPGIFVLYGSKPMCDSPLPPELKMSKEELEKLIESLPPELREGAEIIDCNYNKQWALWERIQDRFKINKYILSKRVSPEVESIYIVDVEKTTSILAKNYSFFKSIIEKEFSPMELVMEIRNSNSTDWEKILQNDIAMGLLYGFGEKNIQLFNEQKGNLKKIFSTKKRIQVGKGNSSHFTIPKFATIEGDEIVQRYETEKSQIEALYKGKDMLELTLKQLSK